METFDLRRRVNVDPKGFVRDVLEYAVEPFGLYLARDFDGHPDIAGIESWLLPALGIRVTDFFFHRGHERDQDFYLDIVDITVRGSVWRTEDHYLDIVVRTGVDAELLDVDDLLAAVSAGHLSADGAQRAIEKATVVLTGLAEHGYRLDRWLRRHGARPTWQRHRPYHR